MDTAERKRRPLRKDALHNRQLIIEAARELFATHGLETGHNEVAQHAGVGVGTIYRRFPTKQSLMDAIFEDGIDEIAALAEAALSREDSWHGLLFFIDELCARTARDRGLREAIFRRADGGDRIEAARLRLDPLLAKVVDRARADGHLRPTIDPTDMPFVSIIAGAVTEFAGGFQPEMWRRYVAILLDGMRTRPGQVALPVEAPTAEQLNEAMRNRDAASRR